MNRLLTIVAGLALFTAMHISAEFHDKEFVYFEYVQDPLNVRSMGMGGAGTALSTGGFSYYNPAGAAFIDRPFLSLDFGRQMGDMTRGGFETAWTFDTWFAGATFTGRTVDYLLTDVTGDLPGSGSSQEAMFSLLGGWKSEWYALGFALNGLPHFIGGKDAFALSGSAGISAMLIPEKLKVGAAVLHAGRLHKGFYDSSYTRSRDSMATTFRAGAAYSDVFHSPEILNGIPYTITVDAEYEKGYNKVFVPVGVEVRPVAPIALRIGKRFGFETEYMTFGIGLTWENVSFDAAFVPMDFGDDATEMKWLMGIRYELPRIKSKNENRVIEADTVVILPEKDTSEAQVASDTIPQQDTTKGTVTDTEATVDTAVAVSDSDSVSEGRAVTPTEVSEPPPVDDTVASPSTTVEESEGPATDSTATEETVTKTEPAGETERTEDAEILPSDTASSASDEAVSPPASEGTIESGAENGQ